MMRLTREQIKKVKSLWKKEFPDFVQINSDIFLRVNGPIITGFEFSISEFRCNYRSRIFLYVFCHDDTSELYFDGYVDYWYSFGRHGLGPKYIGTPEPFTVFCERIRQETTIVNDKVSLTEAIGFLRNKSIFDFDDFYVIAATSLLLFKLSGFDHAVTWTDSKKEIYEGYHPQIKHMIGSSWDVWRSKLISNLSEDSINYKKESFLSKFNKINISDCGIITL